MSRLQDLGSVGSHLDFGAEDLLVQPFQGCRLSQQPKWLTTFVRPSQSVRNRLHRSNYGFYNISSIYSTSFRLEISPKTFARYHSTTSSQILYCLLDCFKFISCIFVAIVSPVLICCLILVSLNNRSVLSSLHNRALPQLLPIAFIMCHDYSKAGVQVSNCLDRHTPSPPQAHQVEKHLK
jgi:hypothetical protein